MFKTIFSRKSSKAWVALFASAASYYIATQTGLPPETTAPIVAGILTWMVPNA